MNNKLLQLHFAQLQAEWTISKSNSYSDTRKQKYHDNLRIIIEGLERRNFTAITLLDDFISNYQIINFVFTSLEFLNNSTLKEIPFEVVMVLETALKEWIPSNDYIIVTSLNNNINAFSFDHTLMQMSFIYEELKISFGVTFEHKLIQINLPESLARDFLANVVLYHELGHFIEKQFVFTRRIYNDIINEFEGALPGTPNHAEILAYFPYLNNPTQLTDLKENYSDWNILAMHISEYFCDVFAAQYINDCANHYLSYLDVDCYNDYSKTHPSTAQRVKFVNQFVNHSYGYLLTQFTLVLEALTGEKFIKRFREFTSSAFENLLPVSITKEAELHYLYIYGWKVWLSDWKKIEAINDLQFALSQEKVYDILNNLIEKSIGNFMVVNDWMNAKLKV